MAYNADGLSNTEQIARAVLDVSKQAIRVIQSDPVPVEFIAGSNEVEISAVDGDSIIIVGTEDGTEGGTQHAIRVDNMGRIATTGSFSGSVTIPPSTDFYVITTSVTTSATPLSFPFTATAVNLKVPQTNTGPIKFGKSDVTTNYGLLYPGEAVTLPVSSSASPVYLVRDAGAGTFEVSVTAVN